MNQDKKEVDEEISDQYLICYMGPNGNITWVSSDELTHTQYTLFKIVNIVLVKPSIILRLIIRIELLFTDVLSFLFKEKSQSE